jgi:uncharacterized membrane protein YbhN (UPF0104 family)
VKAGPPSRSTRWLLRAALSLVAAVLLFRFVPFDAVRSALGRVSAATWLASLGIFFTGHYLNALKLRLLLGEPAAPAMKCVQAQYAGLAANLGLPGLAGGDLVRAAYLVPSVGARRVAVATVVDRVLDTVTLLVIVAVALPLAGAPSALQELFWSGARWVAAIAVAGAAGGAVVLWIGRRTRVAQRVDAAWTDLKSRRSVLGGAAAISFTVQPAFVLTNAWLAREVGVTTGLTAWFVAWPLSKLIAILPISLGGIGVREAALVSILALYGAAREGVLASGILWTGVLTVSGLVGFGVTQALGGVAPAR